MSGDRWPLVSVVITGYKRPDPLRQTVESLLSVVRYEPLELVLADDGSPEELRREMRELPFDRFVFAERNQGLGANTNAGLAAAKGDYILQLQDDWLCTGPADFLERGVRLLESQPSIGLVRFTTAFTVDGSLPPHRRLPEAAEVLVFEPQKDRPVFLYSDQPHLKSRALVDFLGPYKESRYMQRTELDMRDRFNAQTRFQVALIEGYDSFRHIGDEVSHRKPLPAARIGALMDRLPILRTLAAGIRALRRRIRPGG